MTDKLARAKLARAAAALNARSGSALPGLVLMTDDERLADPLAAAHALPRGSMIVVRAMQDERRSSLGVQLRRIAHRKRIKLLIANDATLAARIGADGIHLSQKNARMAAHWRALHPHWIITAATHSLATSHVTEADALFLSPVFRTKSHPGGAALGGVRLRTIAQHSSRPVYALGGITGENAMHLVGAKLVGVAAIGALAV